jgi:group II intron reverse transcriptase/maturase
LQITLYRKAKSSPGYRFWSLYGEVQRADVLETAWRRVKANGGVAGVDGVEIADMAAEQEKEAAWLEALREELRAKTYRPAPVLRAEIAKPDGGVRKLGIPTVKDRVVQMAVYLVLMPIFEADFHPFSFGYRPGRGAHEAVEVIREGLRSGRTEGLARPATSLVPSASSVVDADLAQYFDTIPPRRRKGQGRLQGGRAHGKLLRLVARRVSDGTILQLIKAWLRAPIMEEEKGGGRTMKANPCGTPQGGVISPLLANIYLHPLDEGVNEQCRQKPRMVRFADDLVILCGTGQGAEMKERLARWLHSRGLALNEKKTQVMQSRERGFAFLGFSFRWQQSKKNTAYVHIEPSPEAEQALRDRVRELTHSRTVWRATEEVVREINQVTRGWGNYFALAQYHRSFGQLNTFVAHRLRQWLWRKHGNPCGKYERWPNRELFTQYGLYQMPTPWT